MRTDNMYEEGIDIYVFDDDFEGTEEDGMYIGAYHYVETLYGDEARNADLYGLGEGLFSL